MRLFICLFTIFALGACSTAKEAKTSNPAFLSENLVGDPAVTYKTVWEDLSRGGAIARPSERRVIDTKTGKVMESKTRTRIRVYPYTKPFLFLRNKQKFEKQGYQEKWTTEQIKTKIDTETKREFAEYANPKKQCFGFEIIAKEADAGVIKYWYGNIIQGELNEKLSITEGAGYLEADNKLTRPDLAFAHACTSKPVDLNKPFSIQLEPRYTQNRLPIILEWQGATPPKKTTPTTSR